VVFAGFSSWNCDAPTGQPLLGPEAKEILAECVRLGIWSPEPRRPRKMAIKFVYSSTLTLVG
jgi:hypothetical protein